jgi:hypothetical protein
MTPLSRIPLIAIVAFAIVVGWTNVATARPIGIQTVSSATALAPTVQTHAGSSGKGGDDALPIALTAVVALVAFGTAGHAYRRRPSRRAIA